MATHHSANTPLPGHERRRLLTPLFLLLTLLPSPSPAQPEPTAQIQQLTPQTQKPQDFTETPRTIAPLLDHPDPRVRAGALVAWTWVADDPLPRCTLAARTDPDPLVRSHAVSLVTRAAPPRTLWDGLDPDWPAPALLADAVGRAQLRAAEPWLRDLTERARSWTDASRLHGLATLQTARARLGHADEHTIRDLVDVAVDAPHDADALRALILDGLRASPKPLVVDVLAAEIGQVAARSLIAMELAEVLRLTELARNLGELATQPAEPIDIRVAATRALGGIGGELAVGHLATILRSPAPSFLRREAAWALAHSPTHTDIGRTALERALPSDSSALRRAVWRALLAYADPHSAPAVQAALAGRPATSTAEWALRAHTATALEVFDDTSAERLLAQADPNVDPPLAHALADYALGAPDPFAIPAWIRLLAHRDPSVREAAATSLRNRTHQSFDFDPHGPPLARRDAQRRWSDWWEQR